MHVHSWLPLKDILVAHHATGARRYLDVSLAVALDWIAAHPAFRPRSPDAGDGSEDSFAWYDQAVGLRFCRLAYILDAASREDTVSDEVFGTLLASFAQHAVAVADDREFRRNTNHGFYQALSQLSAATRFAEHSDIIPPDFLVQANARVAQMLRQQYFAEGMHREHSPGYHFATWRALRAAMTDGMIRTPEAVETLQRIEDGLSWLVDGSARIATVGDTDPWTAPPPRRLANISDGRLATLLARGEPQQALKGFPQSGYCSVQDFKGPRRSFLLQATGFHSTTHKHADHLSFVWTENDAEILIDPGRWGYRGRTPHNSELFKLGFWYDAPERVFVESTHAHNVLQADQAEFPRRGVRPYGSGLQAWGEQDGLYYLLSRAPLSDHCQQHRLLVLSPGDYLLVLDLASDRKRCDWRQWFHLGPEFTTRSDANTIRAQNASGVSLCILPMLAGQMTGPVMCGQTDPYAQGWYCPKAGTLAPAPAFFMTAQPGTQVRLATIFALAGDTTGLSGQVDGTLDDARASFRWMQDGARRELAIRIRGPNKVEFGAAPGSWLSRLFS
jgi:hypothetical protein